jgi:Protein of unknown function (DUF3305)
LSSGALLSIPVGVMVERHRASSPWLDFVYRPASVLAGVPEAAPWTVVAATKEVTTYYAGRAVIEFYRTETDGYRDNLACGAPLLWVILRPAPTDVGFELLMVTADPAEGEALTGAGDDLVGTVPMPEAVEAALAGFVAEYHVERAFVKRQRQEAKAQDPGRRAVGGKGRK